MSGRKFNFKVVSEPEDSEIEDNDVDPDLSDDEDLQIYLRELGLQERPATGTSSEPSSPRRARAESMERSTSAPPDIPPLSPARPGRSTSGWKSPPIVKRIRDPQTGYPDQKKLAKEGRQLTGSTDTISMVLAMKGRVYKDEVFEEERGLKSRKEALLASKPNLRLKNIDNRQRFVTLNTVAKRDPQYRHRPLLPQSPSPPDTRDTKFSQPISSMKREKRPTLVMPTGRMGFGDISGYNLSQLRDSMQNSPNPNLQFKIPDMKHELPRTWRPKELAFADRLRRLSPEDRKTYAEYHAEANPHLEDNRAATGSRMVPKPTIGQIREYEHERYKENKKSHAVREVLSHEERRDDLRKRSALPSAINAHWKKPLTPISEFESEPYEYETYEADPETHLIKTTRVSDKEKKREEAARREKRIQQMSALNRGVRQMEQQAGPSSGGPGQGSGEGPSGSRAGPSGSRAGPSGSRAGPSGSGAGLSHGGARPKANQPSQRLLDTFDRTQSMSLEQSKALLRQQALLNPPGMASRGRGSSSGPSTPGVLHLPQPSARLYSGGHRASGRSSGQQRPSGESGTGARPKTPPKKDDDDSDDDDFQLHEW